jgi:predicted porin
MNRSFFAGALLCAVAGPAAAQSNVTVYGVVDADLTYGTGSLSKLKAVGSSGLNGSRLGFRGTEDLGGGLSAIFMLEHGLNVDTGTAASATFWNRQSYVGLSSSVWGTVQLGRIDTPTWVVHLRNDAFGPQGVAAQHVFLSSIESAQPAGIRASNAVNYLSPDFGGFTLHAMQSAGEGAPGKYSGARLSYAAGGFGGDLAYARYGNPAIGDLKALTLGARYRFGDVTVYGLIDRADSGSSFDTRGAQMSASYLVGATDLRVSIAQSQRKSAAGADAGTTRRYGIGAVHLLSKRTALYTSIAHVSNSDGAALALNGSTTAPNHGSSGIDLGIRHIF